MSKPSARISDATAHGGAVVTGDFVTLVGGLPAARKGDVTLCPVHGVAKVASHSATVLIGGAPAARLGDACACQSAGKAASGLPAVLGPGLEDVVRAVVADPAATEGWSLLDGRLNEHDPRSEGVLDATPQAEGSLAKRRVEVQVGDRTGHHDVELGRGQAELHGTLTDRGAAGAIGVGGDVVRHTVELNGATGTTELTGALGSGDLHARGFVGDDGRRVGLGFDVEASASVVSGGAQHTERTTVGGLANALGRAPIFGPSALALRIAGRLNPRVQAALDTPVEVTGGVGASLGSAGAGGGGHAYYDKATGQVAAGGRGSVAALGGIELKLNLVIGEAPPEEPPPAAEPPPGPPPPPSPPPPASVSAPEMGPNVITGGLPTVLIGG